MTRALTLIRAHFINNIRDVANDVQSRIAAKALNDSTQSALFYTKFRVDAPILQSLTDEIHQRCEGHEEYISLMADCYKYYTNVRKRIVVPVIQKRIVDMRNMISDLIQLVSFLITVSHVPFVLTKNPDATKYCIYENSLQ